MTKKKIKGNEIIPNIRYSLFVEYLKDTSDITIIKNMATNKKNLK